jgi:hypothetical protein
MKSLNLFWLALALALAAPAALVAADPPAEKTDLARDLYVEQSKTDFILEASAGTSRSPKVRVFNLSAPGSGAFTVLCFLDGKISSQQKLELPGAFKLNVSGLAKGSHRLTLQTVDAAGRVGRATQTLEVN